MLDLNIGLYFLFWQIVTSQPASLYNLRTNDRKPTPSIPRGITKNHLFSAEQCSVWNKICASLQAGRIFARMHLVTGHAHLEPSYLIAYFFIGEADISRQWPYRLYFQEKCHFFELYFLLLVMSLYPCIIAIAIILWAKLLCSEICCWLLQNNWR